MESRHCGQDKRMFFCPVHNASTPCSLQAFGIRCIAKSESYANRTSACLDKLAVFSTFQSNRKTLSSHFSKFLRSVKLFRCK